MRSAVILIGILVCSFFVVAANAGDVIDKLASDAAAQRLEIRGRGFVTDATHPKRPGDVLRVDVTFRFLVDPATADGVLEFTYGDADKTSTDRYFVRRGAIFQLGKANEEILAEDFGDLSSATIAALSPQIVSAVLAARRENVETVSAKRPALMISWNDQLWRGELDDERVLTSLQRKVFHPVFGDRIETIRYETRRPAASTSIPHRILVTTAGRETANLEVTSAAPVGERPALPKGKPDPHSLTDDDISFRELAPHLFAIDLEPANSRVFVAEFNDHLVVLEGAYNSKNGDRLTRKISERFRKPIRYFAFSHLHGQYVGGVRSYVERGATILVPPTTVPLIAEVVKARHELRPDALSRTPKKLVTETVEGKKVLSDELNALEIYNVESDHTDEYLIFYFPTQKVLLTGDLLFYRGAEQPLRGRSLKLCTTVANLGLEVDALYVSWPLEGYGVRNTIKGDEFRAACAAE